MSVATPPHSRGPNVVANCVRTRRGCNSGDADAAGMAESRVMSEPTTPLPEWKASADDERTVLTEYLDYFRAVLSRKAEGITEEQARVAACPPSDLTLIGLIRHMAEVERTWFRRSLMDEDAPPIFYGAAHPDGDRDGDFHPPPDATMAAALEVYWAEIAVANRNIAAHSMDDLTRGNPQAGSTLRRTIVHMIEEYARHCGHADLLREAIDGATGD